MVDYQEAYKRKCVTADEAVKVVQSGDMVAIPIDTPVQSLLSALLRRKGELENVTILLRNPRVDLGWLQDDLRPSFHPIIDTQAGAASKILNEKKLDFLPFLTSLRFKDEEDIHRGNRPIDVVMIVVSPPDSNGFCRFGIYLSHKLRLREESQESPCRSQRCSSYDGEDLRGRLHSYIANRLFCAACSIGIILCCCRTKAREG